MFYNFWDYSSMEITISLGGKRYYYYMWDLFKFLWKVHLLNLSLNIQFRNWYSTCFIASNWKCFILFYILTRNIETGSSASGMNCRKWKWIRMYIETRKPYCFDSNKKFIGGTAYLPVWKWIHLLSSVASVYICMVDWLLHTT